MVLFMTDSELEREGGNVEAVVAKADAFIRGLQEQVETHKARADATAINAEQTCALIEQKFLTLSGQFSQLENEKQQSFATLERRSTELAQAQGQIHKLEIEAVRSLGLLRSECLVRVGPLPDLRMFDGEKGNNTAFKKKLGYLQYNFVTYKPVKLRYSCIQHTVEWCCTQISYKLVCSSWSSPRMLSCG